MYVCNVSAMQDNNSMEEVMEAVPVVSIHMWYCLDWINRGQQGMQCNYNLHRTTISSVS